MRPCPHCRADSLPDHRLECAFDIQRHPKCEWLGLIDKLPAHLREPVARFLHEKPPRRASHG